MFRPDLPEIDILQTQGPRAGVAVRIRGLQIEMKAGHGCGWTRHLRQFSERSPQTLVILFAVSRAAEIAIYKKTNQPNFLAAIMAFHAVASLVRLLRYYNHKNLEKVTDFLL
jgi:hypothetical protein